MYHIGLGIIDTVYAGTTRKLKNGGEAWIKKDDVTKEFLGVMIEYLKDNDNSRIITVYGKPKYKITLEEISGECLKYTFCPVANHNTNHKACMKITTTENYTIEQNTGENRIEGGVLSISGSVKKTELKDQLESYEGYINDIPLVIDPCKMCKIYKKHNGYDIGDRLVKGVWEKGYCDDCCWCYASKFEVGD